MWTDQNTRAFARMAQLEVCNRLRASPSDESDGPRTSTTFHLTLRPDFYDREHALQLFAMGQPDRQPGGLLNVGYNCYVNAVIQCLAYTPGFRQFCSTMPNVMYQVNAASAFFLDSFAHLFSEMEANKCVCPSWLLADAGLVQETFAKPIQQDAHEYLIDLLDLFEKECRAADPREDSETMISHLFGCQVSSTLDCGACGLSVVQQLIYHDLTISISQYPDLATAISVMTTETEMNTSSPCERCGCTHQVTKKSNITRLPLILVITLMRFDNALHKIEDFFEFPETLVVGDDQEYHLYAMILHEGRHISHGHFVAQVKDSNGDWYKADDVCVYRMKIEAVMNSCPYVLFYKRAII